MQVSTKQPFLGIQEPRFLPHLCSVSLTEALLKLGSFCVSTWKVKVLVAQSCLTVCNPREPTSLLCPWGSPDKNTGVGCHFLLQGSSWPRDQTCISCIAGDPPGKPQHILPSRKRPHGSEEWILWGLRKSRMAGHSSPSSNSWPGIFSQIYHFKPHHYTEEKKKNLLKSTQHSSLQYWRLLLFKPEAPTLKINA